MFYYEIFWAHEVSLMDPKIPNMADTHRIPARKGSAARLRAGQVLTVINTHGSQVVDFWAFNDPDLGELHVHGAHARDAVPDHALGG